MTIVVSWISKEREFPTLWTVADSQLSKPGQQEATPLFTCGSKIFPIRITCTMQEENGSYYDKIYYSATIGMSFAGSSLLALNFHAFISYTLGNLGSTKHSIPSIADIATHAKKAFESLAHSYIDTNALSTGCEISIFGYCPIIKQHQLFHIRLTTNGRDVTMDEFKFINDDSLHIMGDQKINIQHKIISEREEIFSSLGTGQKYWRSPLTTIQRIIATKTYPSIGGRIQMGISYPKGFKLTSIYAPKVFRSESDKAIPELIHQGINLNSDHSLVHVGDCFVEIDSFLEE